MIVMRKEQLENMVLPGKDGGEACERKTKNDISGQHEEMVEHRGRKNNTKSVQPKDVA